MTRRSFGVVVASLMMGVVVAACGKKGPPLAPELRAPRAVTFFNARGTVQGVVLSWYVPEGDARGRELRDLAGYIVERREAKEKEDGDFDRIKTLTIQPEEEGSASGADEVTFLDTEVEPRKRYEYRVIAFNLSGTEGQPSEVLRVTFTGDASLVERL